MSLEKELKCYLGNTPEELLTGHIPSSFIHRQTVMLPLSNKTTWCWLRTFHDGQITFFHWFF